MCVLYKKATKQFVQYDKSTTRSELVTDVSLASDLPREEARKLLHKCTKKLKNFNKNLEKNSPVLYRQRDDNSPARRRSRYIYSGTETVTARYHQINNEFSFFY